MYMRENTIKKSLDRFITCRKTEVCGRSKFISWFDRFDCKMIDLKNMGYGYRYGNFVRTDVPYRENCMSITALMALHCNDRLG